MRGIFRNQSICDGVFSQKKTTFVKTNSQREEILVTEREKAEVKAALLCIYLSHYLIKKEKVHAKSSTGKVESEMLYIHEGSLDSDKSQSFPNFD